MFLNDEDNNLLHFNVFCLVEIFLADENKVKSLLIIYNKLI